MNIFLDTANIAAIEAATGSGIIAGFTTNPSILARENTSFAESISSLVAKLRPGMELLVEVLATEAQAMIAEAKELHALSPATVIKIPMTEAGIAAAAALSAENIPVAITLVFSPAQAVLAANAGARYVAPFVGRLDDISADGLQLIKNIRQIFDRHQSDTKILAASIRSPQIVADLFAAGCNAVTMPPTVYQTLYRHPLTDAGLATFLKDAEQNHAHHH